MPALSSYEGSFRTRLKKKMDAAYELRLQAVTSGGVLRDDPASTGQAYAVEAGYFQALEDVTRLMQEVEDDLLGRQRE